MKSRFLIGIPLAALLISVIVFDGIYPIIIVSLFSFAGTYEVSHASLKRAFRPFPVPAYLFSFLFPYVYYFAGEKMSFLLFLACYTASMILLVIRRPSEPANVLISLFLYIYPILNFVCIAIAANSFSKDANCIAKILMMAVPLISDTSAYFFGRAFGKHKLSPAVSPNKTWEGAFAAVAAGILSGVVICLVRYFSGNESIPYYVIMIVSTVCAVVGMFGDLFASLYKRWTGVKDYSGLFKEHGGVIDRLDSILICAPVVLLLFNLFGIS
ncbi:MAG: phosphatidate cytidylyltransferase [Clostridia bacterium]|nr:phosphatidate cytidylyltransferase [Clostridia bacterium]